MIKPSILTRRGFLRSMGLATVAAATIPAVLMAVDDDKKPSTYSTLASYEENDSSTITLKQLRTAINSVAINVKGKELIIFVSDEWPPITADQIAESVNHDHPGDHVTAEECAEILKGKL